MITIICLILKITQASSVFTTYGAPVSVTYCITGKKKLT